MFIFGKRTGEPRIVRAFVHPRGGAPAPEGLVT